jgi:tetratricopeptide (TPR) repeat protein
VIVWLLASIALAEPPLDALGPVGRSIWEQAAAAEHAEELDKAARWYEQVLTIDPAFTHAVVAWGRVLEADKEIRAAEGVYLRAPTDSGAVEALGRLYLQEERFDPALDAFRRLQNLAWGDPEPVRMEVITLAAMDASAADQRFREYLRFEGIDLEGDEVAEAAAAVAGALEGAGEDVLALAVLEDVASMQSAPEALVRYSEQLDRLRVRQLARQMASSGSRPLSTAQQATMDEARQLLGQVDAADALRSLEQLALEAERSPQVWGALSLAREAAGDDGGAEQAAWMATRLAPLEPVHLIRYADLLVSGYGGRRDMEAAALYQTATLHLGNASELWFRKARAEERSGQSEAAVASYGQYLALAPDGEHADEARAVVEGWGRVAPEQLETPLGSARPAAVNVAAWQAYHESLVYQLRRSGVREADLDNALERVDAALVLSPDFVDAHNLRARVLLESGNLEGARQAWEASLEVSSSQPEQMVELADVLRQQGRDLEARALLMDAAELGASDALVRLADEALAAGDLADARRLLDAYFAGAGSSLTRARALELSDSVSRRVWGRRAASGGGVVAVLVLPLMWWLRRRTGATVEELLSAEPRVWQDVARIGSAIRHEVLKHNTTVLGSVAEALDQNDVGPAQWSAGRLLGADGAVARFRAYVRDLEAVAAGHGVRLNLRHRDPVFAPLIKAVDQLEKLSRSMARRPSSGQAAQLRGLSNALNLTGYSALGALVRKACTVMVDEDLVTRCWDAVRREAAFGDADELHLILEPAGEPELWVRMYRSELEDTLKNLMRNAMQAVIESHGSRVGIWVGVEEDDVTGLERVEIRVLDTAPRRVSTAMIRSRYIERGLGLAVDLISKNGGSIHVEDVNEGGWTKALVVRIPREEAE